MPQALFISDTWIKTHTPFSGNCDAVEMKPFVEEAQDAYIQPITGTRLYNVLMAAVVANTTTPDQDALLEILRTGLAWYSLYRGLPWVNWKVRNRSVIGSGGALTQDGVAADLTTLKYLRDEARGNAEFFGNRAVEHLCANANRFPDYLKASAGEIPAQRSAYRFNMAFDISEMTEDEREFYKRWIT